MTTRGRITIPKEIREALNLKPGSRVDFLIDGSGRVEMRALKSDWRALRGMLKSPHKRPISVREMNEAIALDVVSEYKRSPGQR